METKLWILVTTTLCLIPPTVAEYCFRKIHLNDDTEPGVTTCRGLIDRQSFSTSRACCESKDGKAFARELIPLGKRKKKWKCTPCWEKSLRNITLEGSGWSDWSEWTPCSVSCDVGTRKRQRLCRGNGDTKCEGKGVIVQPCSEIARCPVDGKWGPWEMWSDCTRPCNGGSMNRTRKCNDPPPSYGGKYCDGEKLENSTCNTHGCPVDGGWSDWSSGGTCDVTCGKGKLTRRRLCNNPQPQHSGRFCPGKDFYTEMCDTNIKCPLDGQWSLWSRYTSCTTSCGQGSRQRTRECVAPRPRHGGKGCVGNSTDFQYCYSHAPCPINGQWTDWNEWSMCFARPCSGETGIQTRKRTCSNPLPRFRGKTCSGTTTETQTCYYNQNCPVHGKWCEWQPYSECRQAANNVNFRMRTRSCNCPMPDNGGNTCRGDDYEVNNCLVNGLEEDDNFKSERCKDMLLNRLEGSGSYDDEDC